MNSYPSGLTIISTQIFGHRAFAVAGPTAWYYLPDDLVIYSDIARVISLRIIIIIIIIIYVICHVAVVILDVS